MIWRHCVLGPLRLLKKLPVSCPLPPCRKDTTLQAGLCKPLPACTACAAQAICECANVAGSNISYHSQKLTNHTSFACPPRAQLGGGGKVFCHDVQTSFHVYTLPSQTRRICEHFFALAAQLWIVSATKNYTTSGKKQTNFESLCYSHI